jgi:orotidine-5'-phosphate decarboxylase
MNRSELIDVIEKKDSYLCVGLDTDLNKIPDFFEKNWEGIVEFNKEIIEATSDLAVAYKPNIAFYESLGIDGWKALEKTLDCIPDHCFTIADAKRGDIGNTSKMYAKTFFETYDFDAVTVAPYMGSDSVEPFLSYEDKWVIILGLTSNEGARDFQFMKLENGQSVYEKVLARSSEYGDDYNTMFVIGATKAEYLKDVREIIPNHFLLVPGVGAQGGSLEEVIQYGENHDGGLLINSSRGILYASNGKDFADAARSKAQALSKRK